MIHQWFMITSNETICTMWTEPSERDSEADGFSYVFTAWRLSPQFFWSNNRGPQNGDEERVGITDDYRIFSAQSSTASRLDSFQGSSCKAPQAQRAARFKGFRVPRPGFLDRFKSFRESYRPMFVRKHICRDFSRNSFKIFRDSQRELERVFSRREQLHGTLHRTSHV